MRRGANCGGHWNGARPLFRENRVNGAGSIGSDDFDFMIQVVPQRVAYVGPVRVRIRPQRCFGQHFIRHFDLYLFVDRVYESVITHENSINRNNKKCVRHVTTSLFRPSWGVVYIECEHPSRWLACAVSAVNTSTPHS
jgi:hypothetical protein